MAKIFIKLLCNKILHKSKNYYYILYIIIKPFKIIISLIILISFFHVKCVLIYKNNNCKN
jgi:hypothetical protein